MRPKLPECEPVTLNNWNVSRRRQHVCIGRDVGDGQDAAVSDVAADDNLILRPRVAGLVNAHRGIALQGQVVVNRETARSAGIARAEVARRSDHHRAGYAADTRQQAVSYQRRAGIRIAGSR